MTKKTNSLIFRFGLSVLWKNKSIGTKSIANITQLENILYKELKKKNLSVLNIKYKPYFLNIFVYNDYKFDIKFKNQVVAYYKKVLSLQKTIEKFGLNKKMVLWFLSSANIQKINLDLRKINPLLVNLFFKAFFLLKVFIKLLKSFDLFFYNCFGLCFDSSNFLLLSFDKIYSVKKRSKRIKIKKKLKIFGIKRKLKYNIGVLHTICKAKRIKVRSNNLLGNIWFLKKKKLREFPLKKEYTNKGQKIKKKLRQIKGLIAIRLFKLQLENIVVLTCGRFLDISINNIFVSKGINSIKKVGSRMKKQEFRFIFYLLLLSSQYNQSKMIANYVANSIKTTKKHYLVLRSFIGLVEYFFFKNIINFLGLQLRLTGKLGGKMRRSKYHYKLGKVWLQTLKIGLNYTLSISFTKFGIISIKVWLLHADQYL